MGGLLIRLVRQSQVAPIGTSSCETLRKKRNAKASVPWRFHLTCGTDSFEPVAFTSDGGIRTRDPAVMWFHRPLPSHGTVQNVSQSGSAGEKRLEECQNHLDNAHRYASVDLLRGEILRQRRAVGT